MISPKSFHESLAAEGVSFLAGVPDSLLKEFCAYVDAALPAEKHVIAANEGTAMGLATGYYLATGDLPMVYLQNSGLGNIVNPALSIADPEVYGLPMIILVGWRGKPGVKDEPQHVKQGRVTPASLDAMEIPYRELDGDESAAAENAKWAADTARDRNGPVVLLVHKGAFGKAEQKRPAREKDPSIMEREEAISLVTETVRSDSTIVATTGMISRELYEQRGFKGQDRASDFLTVGGMGHASQIALGIAIAAPEKDVTCIDGDGAVLMHMGGMATIGQSKTGNLLHIVLNNGAHDSVGGQPTVGFDVAMTDIARACGYDEIVGPVTDKDAVASEVARLTALPGRRFLEVRVNTGSRSDLGRPKETPAENKANFMARLRG
ncbi:phosphonopyruvate decarboxylase [Roseovarius aestuarii]|nr:phosphonopyruvate decarboxylase [Roseovarius aestuarii]